MKKWLVLAEILLLSVQLFAQGAKLTIGTEVGFLPGFYENQTFNDYQGILFAPGTEVGMDMSYTEVSARAFLDFTYGIVSIGYHASASRMTTKVTTNISSSSGTGEFEVSNLELRAFAKYPFSTGTTTISPMIGLEWAPCLGGTFSGTKFDASTKMDYSDLSILGGLVTELPIGGHITARTGFLAAYVITSRRGDPFYTGVRYLRSSAWYMEITLGFGYRI